MLRIREDGVLYASNAIADAFAGFHLGDHLQQDGANLQRKIAIIKINTLPTDGTTIVVGGKTYTFKDVVSGANQIKIGNLVTNGGFASTAGWINYYGWTIAAGVATHTPGTHSVPVHILNPDDDTFTNSITVDNVQPLAQEWSPKPVVGYSYVTGFTVSGRTAGSVRIKIGGVLGTARSTNATFAETLVAVSDGELQFVPTADFDGAVDAVTVTNVNTDLKALTVQVLAAQINIDKAVTLCSAYASLGATNYLALLANAVDSTPTLTPDGSLVVIDTAWSLVISEAKLESTTYFKRDITTDKDVKPTVLIERNAGTDKNFLY